MKLVAAARDFQQTFYGFLIKSFSCLLPSLKPTRVKNFSSRSDAGNTETFNGMTLDGWATFINRLSYIECERAVQREGKGCMIYWFIANHKSANETNQQSTKLSVTFLQLFAISNLSSFANSYFVFIWLWISLEGIKWCYQRESNMKTYWIDCSDVKVELNNYFIIELVIWCELMSTSSFRRSQVKPIIFLNWMPWFNYFYETCREPNLFSLQR